MLRIRIWTRTEPQHFGNLDPDPHRSEKQDPDPDPHQSGKVEVLEMIFWSIGGSKAEEK